MGTLEEWNAGTADEFQDTMVVCTNGHVLTDTLETGDASQPPYCDDCGAPTTSVCPDPDCSAAIPGYWHVRNFISATASPPTPPKFCNGCGGQFPWTTRLAVSDANVTSPQAAYVCTSRIVELSSLCSAPRHYDLTKLVRMCEELNNAWAGDNFYSTGMLVRSIIDHVPPIFGKGSFAEVANNISGRSLGKTFKRLDKNLRDIADRFLHEHIRPKEGVPAGTQVNFSQELDVLLQEIVAKLK